MKSNQDHENHEGNTSKKWTSETMSNLQVSVQQRNLQQNEKVMDQMGENVCKPHTQWGFNIQNRQGTRQLNSKRQFTIGQRILINIKKKNLQPINGQQVYEKGRSASLIIREMQIKPTMRYHLKPVRMAIVKKTRHDQYRQGCAEKVILVHCWQERTLVQPLRETVWRLLKRVKNMYILTRTARYLAIPLLGR